MIKYDYIVRSLNAGNMAVFESELNDYGDAGWMALHIEIVAFNDKRKVTFIRPRYEGN